MDEKMTKDDNKATIIRKALTDAAFKAELMKSPNAAIEKLTGVTFPAGVKIAVVEDTATVVHLLLPLVHRFKGGGPGQQVISIAVVSDEQKKRNELIDKTYKSAAFKAEFLKDPNATFEKTTGEKIPRGVTVKVLEDTDKVLHLVLPPAGSMPPAPKA